MLELFTNLHYEHCSPPVFIPTTNFLFSIDDQELIQSLKQENQKRRRELERNFKEYLDATSLNWNLVQLCTDIITKAATYLKNKKPGLDNSYTVCLTNSLAIDLILPFDTVNILFLYDKNNDECRELSNYLFHILAKVGFKIRAVAYHHEDLLSKSLIDANITTQLIFLKTIFGNSQIAKDMTTKFFSSLTEERRKRMLWELNHARKSRHKKLGDKLLNTDMISAAGGFLDILNLTEQVRLTEPSLNNGEFTNPDLLSRYIQKHLNQKYVQFERIKELILRVACLYQYEVSSPELVFSPSLLPLLSRDLRYTAKDGLSPPQIFLRHYTLARKALTKTLDRIVPLLSREYDVSFENKTLVTQDIPWLYQSDNNRLQIDQTVLAKDPSSLLTGLKYAFDKGLTLGAGFTQIVAQQSLTPQDFKEFNDAPAILFEFIMNSKGLAGQRYIYLLDTSGILSSIIPGWQESVGYYTLDDIWDRGYALNEKNLRILNLLHTLQAPRDDNSDDESVIGLQLTREVLKGIRNKKPLLIALLSYYKKDHTSLSETEENLLQLCKTFKLTSAEIFEVRQILLNQNLFIDSVLSNKHIETSKLELMGALIQRPSLLDKLFILATLVLSDRSDWNKWLNPIATSLYQKLNIRLSPFNLESKISPLVSQGLFTIRDNEHSSISYSMTTCEKLYQLTKQSGLPQYDICVLPNKRTALINIVLISRDENLELINQYMRVLHKHFFVLSENISLIEKSYFALTVKIGSSKSFINNEEFTMEIIKAIEDAPNHYLTPSRINLEKADTFAPITPEWTFKEERSALLFEMVIPYLKNLSIYIFKLFTQEDSILSAKIERFGTQEIYIIELQDTQDKLEEIQTHITEQLAKLIPLNSTL